MRSLERSSQQQPAAEKQRPRTRLLVDERLSEGKQPPLSRTSRATRLPHASDETATD